MVVCVYRFAYVEFAEKEMVDEAVKLNESLFKGRQIKVGTSLIPRPFHAPYFITSPCQCVGVSKAYEQAWDQQYQPW